MSRQSCGLARLSVDTVPWAAPRHKMELTICRLADCKSVLVLATLLLLVGTSSGNDGMAMTTMEGLGTLREVVSRPIIS